LRELGRIPLRTSVTACGSTVGGAACHRSSGVCFDSGRRARLDWAGLGWAGLGLRELAPPRDHWPLKLAHIATHGIPGYECWRDDEALRNRNVVARVGPHPVVVEHRLNQGDARHIAKCQSECQTKFSGFRGISENKEYTSRRRSCDSGFRGEREWWAGARVGGVRWFERKLRLWEAAGGCSRGPSGCMQQGAGMQQRAIHHCGTSRAEWTILGERPLKVRSLRV
jgi:hypothetical protein